jgi:hypothetical protein
MGHFAIYPQNIHIEAEQTGSVPRLVVTANVVLSPPIFVTLMMEALDSPETSVPTKVTQCKIREDCTLREVKSSQLKMYTVLNILTAPKNFQSRIQIFDIFMCTEVCSMFEMGDTPH